MYTSLAGYYDILMKETDYNSLVDSLCKQFQAHGNVKTVVDIGCGTGIITTELAKRGYEVIGIDLSEEMLAIAEQRSRNEGVDVLYSCQDMCYFNIGRKVDAVICILDGINYLRSKGKIISCFSSVKKHLNDDGIFIFDINSENKFENIYSNNDYIIEEDGVLCAWSNYYDAIERKCDFQLSIFSKEKDGKYSRLEETQTEYCYSKKEIMQYLLSSGLIAAESKTLPEGSDINNCERIVFLAKQHI